MTDTAIELALTGRVQGVALRWHITEQAKALSLAGVVWNNPDGTVTVRVQGAPQAISNFVNWLRSNPGTARVASFTQKTIPHNPAMTAFTIQQNPQ